MFSIKIVLIWNTHTHTHISCPLSCSRLALDSRSIFLFICTLWSHLVHFYLLPSTQDNWLSGFVWRQFYYSPKPIILRGDEEEVNCTTWQNPLSSSPFNVLPFFLWVRSTHFTKQKQDPAWQNCPCEQYKAPQGYWKWKWSHSVVSDSLRPVDCSPPSSSVHGILQARILEWVAISFSRDTDAHTIAGHSWGALERGTLTTGGVWLPRFQPTPYREATLAWSGSCSLSSSQCVLCLHSFSGGCFCHQAWQSCALRRV